MAVPEQILDPADFVIVPNVFVVDEFDMTDEDGNVVARIDAKFIEKTVARMQQKEVETGDLCPIVIGHTKDNPQGKDEINGPPLIGYFRNWKQMPFFDTGKTGAAPDAWIFKGDVERAKKYPRRSSEVWVNRYEIDPVSFLGATTPARDLGLLKLSRNGSLTYSIGVSGSIFDRPTRLDRTTSPTNRESDMPADKTADTTEKQEKPKPDEGQSGVMKEIMGKIDALTSAVQSLTEKMGGAAGAAAPADAGAAAGAAGGDGSGEPELSDDELNQYLAQMGGGDEGAGGAAGAAAPADDENDKSRKGEKPVQNSAGSPGGDNTNVPNADHVKKLQRTEEELNVLRVKLARNEVKDRLRVAVDRDGADLDATDEKLITELVSMPEDMRENMVVRLSRNKSKTSKTGHADSANTTSQVSGKRVRTDEERSTVMKLARSKGVSYEIAATELGFTVGS